MDDGFMGGWGGWGGVQLSSGVGTWDLPSILFDENPKMRECVCMLFARIRTGSGIGIGTGTGTGAVP